MSLAASAPQEEGRRARRRRELHERIFNTARGLFLSQGFEATTVEQIAEAADIVPATFFNHFPSKEEVLREIEIRLDSFGVAATTPRSRQASHWFLTSEIQGPRLRSRSIRKVDLRLLP